MTRSLDSVCTSIHDRNSPILKPLQGSYSVLLQDGLYEGRLTNVLILQNDWVPSNARSLMFSTDTPWYLDHLVVSLNGRTIPMRLYSVGNTVNPSFGPIETFIGDISAFAGQYSVELMFTKLVQDMSNPNVHGMVDLDAIQFSTIIVPEPSTLALLCVAAAGLCACLGAGV